MNMGGYAEDLWKEDQCSGLITRWLHRSGNTDGKEDKKKEKKI
jgi:hypothetical protein